MSDIEIKLMSKLNPDAATALAHHAARLVKGEGIEVMIATIETSVVERHLDADAKTEMVAKVRIDQCEIISLNEERSESLRFMRQARGDRTGRAELDLGGA